MLRSVYPAVATMPAMNSAMPIVCHNGIAGSSSITALMPSILTRVCTGSTTTVLCNVTMHSGSMNEATAVASSTTRFTWWNVSRLSSRR